MKEGGKISLEHLLQDQSLLSIPEASRWASSHLGKNVTTANITYLIQYGRIQKIDQNGSTFILKDELLKYYDSYVGKRELTWKIELGNDVNWHLSFDYLKEADTTKHVHRLHPYKGKFIPQLVEYFLDSHTDDFKKEVYFHPYDIVLDPFCGSGTTLVQANELNMHAIGIDISEFNSLLSNVKIQEYDLEQLRELLNSVTKSLREFTTNTGVLEFDNHLAEELANFNAKHFPSPQYKREVNVGQINENEYGSKKEREFLLRYFQLVNKYRVQTRVEVRDSFLSEWLLLPIYNEVNYIKNLVNESPKELRSIIQVILSRTVRTCRATTHADLATLKQPISTTYYCTKHGKICKPLFTIFNWWNRYCKDTIKRISEFNLKRTNNYQVCLTADARTFNLIQSISHINPRLTEIVNNKGIAGIFSSPPYVGLIDYHEQHAYAYELFGFKRRDEAEIGPMSKGQGRQAREDYVTGISEVLLNCKHYLKDDFNIFLVVNDKYNLYPLIAERTNLKITHTYKRPVLNRTEKDKGAYAEYIFHMKENK